MYLGNNCYTTEAEAEYYRNKELYQYSRLARHKDAMNKAYNKIKKGGK